MNHRTYDAQRFSPLDADQQDERQESEARLCRRDRRHVDQREPPVDAARGGRLPLRHRYVGRALQDRRAAPATSAESSGAWTRARRSRRSRTAAPRCGAISSSPPPSYPPRVIATNKDTGKVVWDTTSRTASRTSAHRGAARRQGQDHRRRRRRRRRRARLDRRPRRRDRQARVAQLYDSGARRAGQRDLEGQEQRLADRRRRHVGHRHLRSRRPTRCIWGTGNPVPRYDPTYRPGDNLYTNSADLLGSRHRQDELVLPVHARRHVGLRRGRHPHPDRRRGRGPAAQAHHPLGAQRLPLHDGTRQRPDRRCAKPYVEDQLDQAASTRRPASRSTTIPARTSRSIRASPTTTLDEPTKKVCPATPAATISGRRPTARRPSSSTFRRCRTARTYPSIRPRTAQDKDWNGGAFKTAERYESEPHRHRSR